MTPAQAEARVEDHGDHLRVTLSNPGRRNALVPSMYVSLREALEELEKDMDFLLQGDVFTRDQLEGYIALKWEEVYAYEHTPHPIEYAMYYSC